MKRSDIGRKIPKHVAATLVSYRMQLGFVAILIAGQCLQMIFMGVSILHDNYSGRTADFLPFFVYGGGFPLLVYLLAYFTTASYPQKIARWFVAMLKTVIVMTSFAILQAIRGSISSILYNPFSYRGSVPPSWMNSVWVEFILMAMCLSGMLLVTYLEMRKGRES